MVGAGICGLAHALAAARLGKRVVVIDRDAQANGASIRNFGFVTVTGPAARANAGSRAMRSRDVWLEVAPAGRHRDPAARPACDRAPAGSPRRARGVHGHRDGRGLRAARAGARSAGTAPMLAQRRLRRGALTVRTRSGSSSREAIPKLAALLERAPRRHVPARDRGPQRRPPDRLETSRGSIAAEAVIVCPGDDFRHASSRAHRRLWPDPLQAAHDAARCPRASMQGCRR